MHKGFPKYYLDGLADFILQEGHIYFKTDTTNLGQP